MIEPAELGVDEALALRVLGVARSFAPLLDSIGDAQTAEAIRDRETAVAILSGVAAEARDRGSRLVKAQRIGPAGVDYADAGSWFSADDRAALINLCAKPAATSSGPRGHFPKPGITSRLWPEEYP
jgi:hypothetical protein